MRTPRTALSAPAPAPRKRAPRAIRSNLFAPSDILWWAAVNQREPFISTARRIKQAGGTARAVRWNDDNTMTLMR